MAVRSKLGRGQYRESNPERKFECFNRLVARFCCNYLRKHPELCPLILVMDAAGAKTTNTLRVSHIDYPMVTFTNNWDDYIQIDVAHLRDIIVCYYDASIIYASVPKVNSLIVIHDGTRTARKTMSDMRCLMCRRFPYLLIIVNVSTRDGDLSHLTFAKDMRQASEEYGYEWFDHDEFGPYAQTSAGMRPFWFEMQLDRKSRDHLGQVRSRKRTRSEE